MENPFTECAKISKTWTVDGGLFNLFRKKTIRVDAEQVELEIDPSGMCATAKVAVYVNDKLAHQADVPFALPKSELMLPMQVFLLSQSPRQRRNKWAKTMEAFCYKCEGFAPPEKIWWPDEPIF